MIRRRGVSAAVATVLCGLAVPPPASAHGLVGRADLPIPLWLFAWAAAIVMIVSFVALEALWPRPRLQQRTRHLLFKVPAVLDPLLGVIGVGLFALVVYAGLDGTSVVTANLAPTFIYVVFWVGVPVLSVLIGDAFRPLNPWRAMARAAGGATARLRGAPWRHRPYPERWGCWPAVAGLAGFSWLELVYIDRQEPHTLALLALGYAAVQLIGMALFGIDQWTKRGDAFSVYFSLMARLSPLEWEGRRVYRRRLLSGVPDLELVPGTVALLCVLIGSTTFDGLSNSGLWGELAPWLARRFRSLGADDVLGAQLAYTAGLALAIAVIATFYRVTINGMRSVAPEFDARELTGRFVHTLVPIAFAYVFAHYFSLLVLQGQSMEALASDPLGNGADVFGTAHTVVNYTVISAGVIWCVQVVALVTGHVGGLLLAHDRAIASFPNPRKAVQSQYWMLAVMVGLTSLALWLLSAVAT